MQEFAGFRKPSKTENLSHQARVGRITKAIPGRRQFRKEGKAGYPRLNVVEERRILLECASPLQPF
ncbi:MAG: hypothetical protein CMQ50_06585 [Gammaproteobacteria bacterium]|nr:hypothetical protein [Gammaproteobacteria bacterium]MBG72547.1 hypothetical protein [Gammaproteobacteria bacterium]HCP48783.1 hypothetical protein [Gammaproteobacteria bacterium]